MSARCAPSLFDGCEAQLVASNYDNPAESFCKEMLDSPRHVLLDGFWNAAGAMLAFGGCCILFYVAKLVACTGLAKRSKPGQEASKSRKELVILRSPQVKLRCGGLPAAALAGGRMKLCKAVSARSAHVIPGSVMISILADWFSDFDL